MIFIANFNNTRNLQDIKNQYDYDGKTNINYLIDGFANGKTIWSVPKETMPGDIILFMCAKEARHNLGLATSNIPAQYGNGFTKFVDVQKMLYKKYSGYLLGCGIIQTAPIQDNNWWMSDIYQLRQFTAPVHISEYRNFITISRTNAITYLNNEQWEHLKWIVNQKNPGFFQNVTAPYTERLNSEFEEAIRKEGKKSISSLKKKAEKAGGVPSVSTVQAKYYYRNPTIAAYVKKRANGFCQLCGQKAPFYDENQEPYLECHHIDWLSKGGMDSIDNCVALCPNCHRKMHIVNSLEDINALKSRVHNTAGG